MQNNASYVVALISAALGALLYALLAFGVIRPNALPYFGTEIYDALFHRMAEGRLDLPMRMLRFEGHYMSDGTGYLYHGIAPLITRIVLAPFVALNDFPTAAFSIWLWSAIGTAFYQAALHQMVLKFNGNITIPWAIAIAASMWLFGPGIYFVVTLVLYHEPLSVAFAMSAAAIFVMVRYAFFDLKAGRAIIALAVIASLMVHARPHVAIGLYAGTVCLMMQVFWMQRRVVLLPCVAALAIMLASGLAVLALNEARFGSAVQSHGSFDAEQEVGRAQYGVGFFDPDYGVTGWGAAFSEQGIFNPWRILPNMAIYTFDYPEIHDRLASLHAAVTVPIAGEGKLEAPHYGMLSTWPAILLATIIGLTMARPLNLIGWRALPLLLATGIAAAFVLSFATVAFRYRFEVWPLLMAVIILTYPGLVARFGQGGLDGKRAIYILYATLFLGVNGTIVTVLSLNESYQERPNTFYAAWDAPICTNLVTRIGLPEDDHARLCADPDEVFRPD